MQVPQRCASIVDIFAETRLRGSRSFAGGFLVRRGTPPFPFTSKVAELPAHLRVPATSTNGGLVESFMPYTKGKREEKTTEAIRLSSRGLSIRAIAQDTGVSGKTIRKWMDDEFARRAEHRDEIKERAISRYEEVTRVAWERLDKLDDRSLNVSGLLNVIRLAQERIDKITGAEAPAKVEQEVRPSFDLGAELRELDRQIARGSRQEAGVAESED